MDTFIIDLSIFEQRFKKEANRIINIIFSDAFDEQHFATQKAAEPLQRKQLMKLEELVNKYNQIKNLIKEFNERLKSIQL